VNQPDHSVSVLGQAGESTATYLVLRLLPLVEEYPGRNWSRDLLKSIRFLFDDDIDKYLIFLLQFITSILFCKFD
jgi:hypothetical protein